MNANRTSGGILSGKRAARIAAVMLSVHALLLAWSAYRHSPTLDEVGHLPAGLAIWELGRFDLYRVNPPLVRMTATIPLLATERGTFWSSIPEDAAGRPEFQLGREFIAAHGEGAFWRFTLARWAVIPFCLLGGFVCWSWARALYGELGGLVALVLWCFSPTVLGNGWLITPDTGAAAFGIGAAYLFWRWLKKPRRTSAFAAGVVFGLAQLAKFTFVFFFLLWPLLWLLVRWKEGNSRLRQNWSREALQLAGMLLLSVAVINLGYGFEGSFTPLKDFDFLSQTLRGKQTDTENPTPATGNRFRSSWIGSLPLPLPSNYVRGIDFQKREFEHGRRSYLRGRWSDNGFWYYYLYALAVKVPLGTFLLAIIALASQRSAIAVKRDEVVLLLPAVSILLIVSWNHSISHFRYLLPAFPFIFVWLGRCSHVLTRRTPVRAALTTIALGGTLIGSLWVYPHSLSYFNVAAGGPRNGHRHLNGSALDWGQDLLYLKRWLDAHGTTKAIGLLYYGAFDPRMVGIQYQLPPPGSATGIAMASNRTVGPQPGWYAVSVNVLSGTDYSIVSEHQIHKVVAEDYSYFGYFQPVATAGYSIYIYHITPDEANRVRREMGLPVLEAGEPEG